MGAGSCLPFLGPAGCQPPQEGSGGLSAASSRGCRRPLASGQAWVRPPGAASVGRSGPQAGSRGSAYQAGLMSGLERARRALREAWVPR